MSKNEWVLIRGIMSESFHWHDFILLLQKEFPQDHFHTADILGNGRQNDIWTPISVSKNIEGLRQQVSTSTPKIVLGFSLGGMLGIEWARRYPEEVRHLFLLNSSTNSSWPHRRMTPFSLKQIYTASKKTCPIEREKVILQMTSNLSNSDIDKLAPAWGQRAEEVPVKTANFFRQLALATQVKTHPKPNCAVSLIAGLQDKVVSPSCTQLLARKWKEPALIHPEAGHDITLDRPGWVLEVIKQRLALATTDQHPQPKMEPTDKSARP